MDYFCFGQRSTVDDIKARHKTAFRFRVHHQARSSQQLPCEVQRPTFRHTMHSLAEDVPRAITNVLSTHDWRGRKQLIDQVYVDQVHFWHLFHDCRNRRELFGVYQMWGEKNGPFE